MNENKHIINYEEVMNRLKDKPIENYTKTDLFNRFVTYGTTEELNKPAVQRLFLKYECEDTLLDMLHFITNKSIINALLNSKLPEYSDVSVIKGTIINIEKSQHYRDFDIKIILEDSENSKIHKLDFNASNRNELKIFQNNIINYKETAVISEGGTIRCFMKYYKDIEYQFKGGNNE